MWISKDPACLSNFRILLVGVRDHYTENTVQYMTLDCVNRGMWFAPKYEYNIDKTMFLRYNYSEEENKNYL